MINKIFSSLKIVTLAVVLSFGLSYVYAWTAPTQSPPSGNVSAPINTSATAQTKAGGLTVGSITATQHCIGASCITSWPTSGVTPPAGSEFLNTSATAQTKSGAITAVGLTTTNRLTVSEAGGAYTYITMKDDESPNGVKYIHANSNVVGFLSGYGGWLSYWDNSGNQQNIGRVTATEVCTTAGKCLSAQAAGGGAVIRGFYQTGYSGCMVANPFTGGCSCPAGSTTHLTGVAYLNGFWSSIPDYMYACY